MIAILRVIAKVVLGGALFMAMMMIVFGASALLTVVPSFFGPPREGVEASKKTNYLRSLKSANLLYRVENDEMAAYRVDADPEGVLEPYLDRSIDMRKHPLTMSAVEGTGVFVGLGWQPSDKTIKGIKEKLLNMTRDAHLTNSYGEPFDGRENVVFMELPSR